MPTRDKPALTRQKMAGAVPAERRVHMGEEILPDGRRALRVVEADPDGRIVTHARVPDHLQRLIASGLLTPAMSAAATTFAERFERAHLSSMRCSSLEVMGGAGGSAEVDDRTLAARRHIAQAIQALGGTGSHTASCAWHVLGEGMALNEWRRGRAWGSRRMDWRHAQGVLIATLEVLGARYGFSG